MTHEFRAPSSNPDGAAAEGRAAPFDIDRVIVSRVSAFTPLFITPVDIANSVGLITQASWDIAQKGKLYSALRFISGLTKSFFAGKVFQYHWYRMRRNRSI